LTEGEKEADQTKRGKWKIKVLKGGKKEALSYFERGSTGPGGV